MPFKKSQSVKFFVSTLPDGREAIALSVPTMDTHPFSTRHPVYVCLSLLTLPPPNKFLNHSLRPTEPCEPHQQQHNKPNHISPRLLCRSSFCSISHDMSLCRGDPPLPLLRRGSRRSPYHGGSSFRSARQKISLECRSDF